MRHNVKSVFLFDLFDEYELKFVRTNYFLILQ